MFRTLDNLFDRARGARGRSGAGEGRPQGGVTRRRFVQGTVAAAGAGMAAIALSSCSSGGDSQQEDGEPQVVTDSSQIVAVLDGDYENVSNSLSASSTWSLPLGTMLFHNGGNTWAAAMLTPESATSVNTVGVLSLSSGNLTTLLDVASLGASYSFFDVRCSDQVYAWIEINYTDGSWVLLGQGLSNGALYGSPVQLTQATAIGSRRALPCGIRASSGRRCRLQAVIEQRSTRIAISGPWGRARARRFTNRTAVSPRLHASRGRCSPLRRVCAREAACTMA